MTFAYESGKIQVLESTDGHPFWVMTDEPDLSRTAAEFSDGMYHENVTPGQNGYWVEAKDLRPGDAFLEGNGELSALLSTEWVEFDENVTVYNFSVEGDHNYFVILEPVENSGCPKGLNVVKCSNVRQGKDFGHGRLSTDNRTDCLAQSVA